MLRRLAFVMILGLALAAPAAAQTSWGLSLAVTPSWETGPGINHLFSADKIDMQGSEFRLGMVRGQDRGNDWGLAFVRTTIDNNSSLDVDVTPCGRGNCGTFLRTIEPTRLTGFEFHYYEGIKTWRDRYQIGTVGAVGLGWLRGNIYKRTTSDTGDSESYAVKAGELFPPTNSVMPLLRIEIAGTALVVPGLKVRASGGFSMPGYHTFGLTFMYLIPR